MKSINYKRLFSTILLSSLLIVVGGCTTSKDEGKDKPVDNGETGKEKTNEVIKVSGTVSDIQKYKLFITTEEKKDMEFIDKDSEWHYINSELTVGDKVEIDYVVNSDKENEIKEAWQKTSKYAEEEAGIKTVTGKITDIQKQYYMINVDDKDVKIQNTDSTKWHFVRDELTIGDVVKVKYEALASGENKIIEAWQQPLDNVKTATGKITDIQKQYYMIHIDGKDVKIQNTDSTIWHFVRHELTIGDSVKVEYETLSSGENAIIEAWQQR